MKKAVRVLKKQEFTKIIQTKRFVKTKAFVAYYVPRSQNHARVGISASKKLGNAVVRNKIKRQVRMMVDALYTFDENYDTILIVRYGYLQESFEKNKQSLAWVKRKLDEKVKGQSR